MTTKLTHTDLDCGIEIALIKDYDARGKCISQTVRVVDLDSGNLVMARTFTGSGANMKAASLYRKHVRSLEPCPYHGRDCE